MLNFQQKVIFMKKYFEVLRKCPLFTGIQDDHILKMLTCLGARVESFDKKYTIVSEGTPARFIGIMLSGSAQIIQFDYYGNRSIVGNISPSELFLEAFACAEVSEVPVSIVATEPCEIVLLNCNCILHTCEHNCGFHQQMIYNLMRNLASKNLSFHRKLEVTSKRTTRDKLMTYLMMYAKTTGSNEFEIPFDRQELADYLEVDRSGLSSEISKLRREGILESNRKHFELL